MTGPVLRTTIDSSLLSRRLPRKGIHMYFDQNAFGKRLKTLREEKGLSQEQAAEELNISVVHYRFIERVTRGCSIDLLLDFASFFHVSTDYLLLGKRADREYEIRQLESVQSILTELIRKM